MASKSKVASRTNNTVTVGLSKKSQQAIMSIVEQRTSKYDWSTQRERMLHVDKAMQLEEDKRRAGRDSNGYAADTQPPIVKPEVDTAHAFFVDLFCSGDPMFKVIETNTNAEAAKMMQAQVTSDELHYGYPKQVSQYLRDCLKYNIAALDVSWDVAEIFQPMNDITFDAKGEAEATTTLYRGNKIKRIDPYNLIIDKSIPINEQHERAAYGGYYERVTMLELHELLASAKAADKVVLNETPEMWSSSPRTDKFYVPTISQSCGDVDSGAWGSFFFPDTSKVHSSNKHHAVNYKEHYELTTMYMRIIPSMFGIDVTSKDRVQIWKFVIVNNQYIILAERQTNAHNKLGLLVTQMDDSGVWSESKSMAEMLVPYQNQSTQMQDALLGMVWKAVSDKGIYDSRRINKRDMEAKNPTAKIAARPSANSNDLRGAYLPMPFDSAGATMVQNGMGMLRSQVNEISGQNNANRGQFQKGNKTMAEYQDVMSNSDARKYVQAILLESVAFQPLKTMMKLNILQFAQASTVSANSESVEINPAEMRKQVADFRVADGLKNVERIAKTGAAAQAFQMMAPYAQLAPAYGIDPFLMITNWMRATGLDLDEYQPQQAGPNAALLPQNAGGTGNEPPTTY